MRLKHIRYSQLNAKQKEIYNFQKVAAALADYGFNCIKLTDDWQGADFLAYHINARDTLRVQLKARFHIAKKYSGKELFICFPLDERWYLIPHDKLVELAGRHTTYLSSRSWKERGSYSTDRPGVTLRTALNDYGL